MRLADDDLRDVVAPGVAQYGVRQVVAGEHDGRTAKLFGELQRLGHAPRGLRVAGRAVRPLDGGDRPGRVHHVGEAPAGAHQRWRHRVARDQHQDALARRPWPFDAAPTHGVDQLVVDRLGDAPQRHLAQSGQVLRLEEVGRGDVSGVGHVDLALGETLAKFVRGDVDQLDVVGARERRVRHGLALAHAGDLPDHVDQALQVLDVERGPDVDPGGQQLLHVLPALGMARTWRVGVGVLVDQQQLRLARQRRVEVELHQRAAAILDRPARQDLEVRKPRLGLLAAMGLDHADQHLAAVLMPPMGLGEHLVGLADPRRHAEEHFEPTAPRFRRFG